MTQTNNFPLRRLTLRILRLPRLARIVIAALFAFAAVIVVDRIFAPTYYTSAAQSSSTISVIVGVAVYSFGWWALIGFTGEERQPSPIIGLYVLLSVILLLITLALVLGGITVTYLPSS